MATSEVKSVYAAISILGTQDTTGQVEMLQHAAVPSRSRYKFGWFQSPSDFMQMEHNQPQRLWKFSSLHDTRELP
ncbi:hypothetical protein PV327_010365, partial [Microctonus hyperodae]